MLKNTNRYDPYEMQAPRVLCSIFLWLVKQKLHNIDQLFAFAYALKMHAIKHIFSKVQYIYIFIDYHISIIVIVLFCVSYFFIFTFPFLICFDATYFKDIFIL